MAFDVKNGRRLNAKLKALRTRTAEAVKPAVGQAAQMIVEAQQHLVPVHQGDLRDSITWRFDAEFGRETVNETRAVISAGDARAPYAAFVEHGTSDTPAQPFFFPGYRATRKRARAIIAAAVRKAVKQAAGGSA